MKRMILTAVVVLLASTACGNDNCENSVTTKCNQNGNQKANDHILPQSQYDDYFVNDSDGEKDDVFTVYHNIRVQGQLCDIVKVYESSGIAVSTVCVAD